MVASSCGAGESQTSGAGDVFANVGIAMSCEIVETYEQLCN